MDRFGNQLKAIQKLNDNQTDNQTDNDKPMNSMLYSVPQRVPYFCVLRSHYTAQSAQSAQGRRPGCVGNGSERSLAISFWP